MLTGPRKAEVVTRAAPDEKKSRVSGEILSQEQKIDKLLDLVSDIKRDVAQTDCGEQCSSNGRNDNQEDRSS